jgi:hypothetical protein
MMKTAILVLLGITACYNLAYAQDKTALKAVIEKINDAARQKNNIRTTLVYQLYKDYASAVLLQQDSVAVLKFQESSLLQGNGVDSFTDGTLDVLVQHEDKVIALARHSPLFNNVLANYPLDSLLLLCNHFEINQYGEATCLYMGLQTADAVGVSICYDNASYLIKKVVIYYRDERKMDRFDPKSPSVKPRLEIHYRYSERSDPAHAANMKMGYYISKKGKDYIPSAHFKGFRVINQTIEQ